MDPPLPLKSVVLFIACGGMVCIIVFIFAKRQITRFALKSRGAHVAIGSDAPKSLRQEIERRLQRTKEVRYEPQLLNGRLNMEDMEHADLTAENCHFFYRMKAVDAVVLLDEALARYSIHIRRQVGQHTLRSFLLELRQDRPLEGINLELIEKFTEAYDHARHDPMEFGHEQYQEFLEMIDQFKEHINNKKNEKDIKEASKDDLTELPEKIDTNIGIKVINKQGVDDLDLTATEAIEVETGEIAAHIEDTSQQTLVSEEGIQITYRPGRTEPTEGHLPLVPGSSTSGSTGHIDGNSSHSGSARNSENFETSV